MRTVGDVLGRFVHADWLPAFLGAVLIWLATAALAGQGLFGTLQQAVIVASFLALVGFGEVIVISIGRGNIDLSVPYVITLSAYLGARVMNGTDAMLLPAIALTLILGVGVGACNYAVIRLLAIPPLIATLAVGFILRTIVELIAAGGARTPSPLLTGFVNWRLAGISLLALTVIVLGLLMHVLLMKSRYGREVLAAGQSADAARLAGISVQRVEFLAYVICAVMASVCGLLLGAYAHGPSLDMAGQYQLGAIAVVVLGGSAIAGGRSNVAGVWWAAVLLTLLGTLVSVTAAGPGVQRIVEGAVIVAVLAVMPKRGLRR